MHQIQYIVFVEKGFRHMY